MGIKLQVPYPSHAEIDRNLSGQDFKRNLWVPSSFDYDVFEDKFYGDSLDVKYPAAKTNGTSAAVTFTEHNVNGFIELVSGTDNDGYAGQGLGLHFTGDRGVLAEFLVKTPSAVTNLKFECGVSDADDDAGAVLVKATPTSTAEDYAVFVVDTDDDANIAFHSAKANTEVTTSDIQSVIASTFYVFAVRIVGDVIEGYIDGKLVASHAVGIEGGSALTPWVFCQARSVSASRTVQLHKWRVTQPAYS